MHSVPQNRDRTTGEKRKGLHSLFLVIARRQVRTILGHSTTG
jgi:hypothetical protein